MKKSTDAFHAFDSPNMVPLAKFGTNIEGILETILNQVLKNRKEQSCNFTNKTILYSLKCSIHSKHPVSILLSEMICDCPCIFSPSTNHLAIS